VLKMFTTVDVGVDFRVFSRAMLIKTRVETAVCFINVGRCFGNPDMKIHIQRSFCIHPVSCNFEIL
jgi:hypothetical protein